jgi:hypothetical protein
MLPECCVIDDVYKPLPADTDSKLTKRRSFGDQYLLFSRQDTSDYMENNFPPGREPIRDMIVVQVFEFNGSILLNVMCVCVSATVHVHSIHRVGPLQSHGALLAAAIIRHTPANS